MSSPESGRVQAMDTRRIGRLVQALGGGRLRETDSIDPSVGLSALCQIGQQVAVGDCLALVHAPDEALAQRAARELRAAIRLGSSPIAEKPPVIGSIREEDLTEDSSL